MSGLKRQNVCAKSSESRTDAFPTSPINRRGFDVIERLVSWLVNLQAFHPSHPNDSGSKKKSSPHLQWRDRAGFSPVFPIKIRRVIELPTLKL